MLSGLTAGKGIVLQWALASRQQNKSVARNQQTAGRHYLLEYAAPKSNRCAVLFRAQIWMGKLSSIFRVQKKKKPTGALTDYFLPHITPVCFHREAFTLLKHGKFTPSLTWDLLLRTVPSPPLLPFPPQAIYPHCFSVPNSTNTYYLSPSARRSRSVWISRCVELSGNSLSYIMELTLPNNPISLFLLNRSPLTHPAHLKYITHLVVINRKNCRCGARG